jgi:hypothetical protein
MGELRACGLMVKEAEDSFYCPFLIAERRRDAVKSELRLLMVHYRQRLVSGQVDRSAGRFSTTSASESPQSGPNAF